METLYTSQFEGAEYGIETDIYKILYLNSKFKQIAVRIKM